MLPLPVPSVHCELTCPHAFAIDDAEQRKATLRRVTMELEEADEIVSTAVESPWRAPRPRH